MFVFKPLFTFLKHTVPLNEAFLTLRHFHLSPIFERKTKADPSGAKGNLINKTDVTALYKFSIIVFITLA
jgi:hypothetical protein